MVNYHVVIYPEALQDIQNSIHWYNGQLPGLGEKFFKQTLKQINKLEKTATLYTIRYAEVRCMVIRKFPFMVHYVLNEERNQVAVYAVFHTSRNPEIWTKRIKGYFPSQL